MDPLAWQQYADQNQTDFDGSRQILVIDDDRQRAETLSVCLWSINPFGIRSLTTFQATSEQIDVVDVVLVSLEMPNADRLAAATQLVCTHPGSLLVGYGAPADEDDSECLEALRLAGGWDPLPYPFDPATLVHAIRVTRLKALRNNATFQASLPTGEAPSILKLIAVYSPKGGVGTSTLAVNLAATLAAAGVSTALVDGDLEFGSHHVFLDLAPVRTILWGMEELADDITSEGIEESLLDHASGIRALLAPPDPELAEQVNAEHMRRVLKILRARYRVTIVDAGSGDDKRTWAMLGLADVVLVPIVPEMPAIKIFRELLRQAPTRGLYATRLIPIMMRSTSVLPGHIQSIESMLRMSLPWRIRSDGRRAMDSITAGTPFVLGSPESPLSQEVRALAACLSAEDGLTRLHTGPRSEPALEDRQHTASLLAHKAAS